MALENVRAKEVDRIIGAVNRARVFPRVVIAGQDSETGSFSLRFWGGDFELASPAFSTIDGFMGFLAGLEKGIDLGMSKIAVKVAELLDTVNAGG